MSNSNDIPFLERPSFFDGQRLMAHDLAGAQNFNRELRWLHNRSLHDWGIAFGFAVEGSRGDQLVKVGVGYAIDCMGRDLVLDAPIEMPIPAVASVSGGGSATYYLTASYAEDAQLVPVTRTGVCKTSGAVRRPEMPIIRWQDPDDTNSTSRWREGQDVVLASVEILNCRLAKDVSTRERRQAAPAQQPYVAAGRTMVGATDWRLWPDDKAPLGVATTVTTSEAGFQTKPRYQAHIIGERKFQMDNKSETIIIDGYTQIAQATASSFDVQVILPAGATAGIVKMDNFTIDDYKAVVSRITKANPDVLAENIINFNGPVLAVGQTLSIFTSYPRSLGQLVINDFKEPLEKISKRNKGVTFNQLLRANGWNQNLNNVMVELGQKIAIPGPALDLNPAKVFKSEFMDVLKKDLAWHVVWTGVEG